MTNNIKYSQLDGTPSDYELEEKSHARRQARSISLIISFLAGLIAMGVIAVVYSLATSQKSSLARNLPYIRQGSDPVTGLPASWSHGDCGNSLQDAKARNCRYSIILHSWLPQSCLTEADDEDEKEMYKDRLWSYKSSSGRNLTLEGLGAGDYEYFQTSLDWHVTHCMSWIHTLRAIITPVTALR
ncbi:hypothetical protein F53441_7359 [Fusarium austroafricanum]|uniref:Uncharacterized protein n=1 Tax=Fusarium austroafricanum TaxID=2364996 RepID=A0A8H4KDQ3_9HYPO|nr:hypothetical protein F53441_7359 [Fusarium austroafricanum]